MFYKPLQTFTTSTQSSDNSFGDGNVQEMTCCRRRHLADCFSCRWGLYFRRSHATAIRRHWWQAAMNTSFILT